MDIKWHNENEPHMRMNEKNGVKYLTDPAFEQLPDIVHSFRTRIGGDS